MADDNPYSPPSQPPNDKPQVMRRLGLVLLRSSLLLALLGLTLMSVVGGPFTAELLGFSRWWVVGPLVASAIIGILLMLIRERSASSER